MQKNNTKLVLFDCDGTLIDSESINAKAMSDILISLGHHKYTTSFCLHNFIGCSALEIINTLKKLDIKNPDQILHKMHLHALTLAKTNLQPIKNAIQTLEKLITPKCIVTNGDRNTVIEFLRITKIDTFFKAQTLFTRDQVSQPKPSPEIYLFAASKMNVPTTQCLVVEDSVIGITAAKKAGMKVLGFTGANSFHEHMEKQVKDAGADYIIHNLLDIFKYVN